MFVAHQRAVVSPRAFGWDDWQAGPVGWRPRESWRRQRVAQCALELAPDGVVPIRDVQHELPDVFSPSYGRPPRLSRLNTPDCTDRRRSAMPPAAPAARLDVVE